MILLTKLAKIDQGSTKITYNFKKLKTKDLRKWKKKLND
jgi:hypothetical protein